MRRRVSFIFVSCAAALLLAAGCDRASAQRNSMSSNDPTNRPPAEACSTDENAACGTTHWQSKSEEEWRRTLTPEQYRVAREAGTEAPFTGKYYNTKTPGVYECAACGQALFSSETKFDSGTGWPSFYRPITESAVSVHRDASHGMARTEIRCAQCESHLGHVFEDGPPPTGLRYCMNSAVLSLVPEKP
jgi:peptide-methionine (R)-S-oxide reductase